MSSCPCRSGSIAWRAPISMRRGTASNAKTRPGSSGVGVANICVGAFCRFLAATRSDRTARRHDKRPIITAFYHWLSIVGFAAFCKFGRICTGMMNFPDNNATIRKASWQSASHCRMDHRFRYIANTDCGSFPKPGGYWDIRAERSPSPAGKPSSSMMREAESCHQDRLFFTDSTRRSGLRAGRSAGPTMLPISLAARSAGSTSTWAYRKVVWACV